MTSETQVSPDIQTPDEKPISKRSKKTAVIIGGKTVYLNNRELMAEIKIAKEKGRLTDKLAAMLSLLCARYARKGNFVNYSYNEDMQSYAMLMLVKTWNSFNPEKGSNPFAFFTQCIKNSFRQYLNHEKKHRDIRDAELISQGLNPSFGYQSGVKDIEMFDDEQDYHSTYERGDVADHDIDIGEVTIIKPEAIPDDISTDTDSTEPTDTDDLPL